MNTIEDLKNLEEILKCLIDHSYSAVIKNNFIKSFYEFSIPNDNNEYTLYGNIRLFGAKSFRLTSSHPNLLNLPSTESRYAKAVKRCFAARNNNIFFMVDLSALEDRVIANLSGDKNKCAIFLEGIDGHCLNSYMYYKEEIENELPRLPDEDLYTYIKRYHKEVENGNSVLKAIRQKSKPKTFKLNYGGYPDNHGLTQEIFDRYHNELHPGITNFREDYVLPSAISNGRIHLGLGCYIYTQEPKKEIRTIFNACSQFWSILTLLTINKLNSIIRDAGLSEDIKIISTIYDSVYIYMKDDSELIKWINDTIIPLITADFIKNQIVPNEAEAEIGYNWYDTVKIRNNASLDEVKEAKDKALNLIKELNNECSKVQEVA